MIETNLKQINTRFNFSITISLLICMKLNFLMIPKG